MNTTVLDSAFDRKPQDSILTRVYLVAGHRIRTTVHRNFYEDQSSARVEVFTPELTWTYLTNSPTRVWWEAAKLAATGRKPSDEELLLENVADDLARRAAMILP